MSGSVVRALGDAVRDHVTGDPAIDSDWEVCARPGEISSTIPLRCVGYGELTVSKEGRT